MQAGLYQSPPSQRQPTPQASHRPEEAVGLHHRQGCSEVSDTPAPAMGSRASGPCCVLEDPGVRGAVFRPDGLPAPKMSEATSCREKSNLSPETASSRSISKSPGPSHHHRTVQSSPPAPVASPDAQLTNKGTATFKTQQKVTDQSKGLSGESEELGNSLMPESKSCSDQLHGESHAGAGSSGSTQETSAPQSLASSDSADGRGAVPIGLPQSETTVNEEGIPAAVNPLRASDRCSSTTDSCRRKISESTGDDRHTSVSSAHWRTPPRDESLSAETRFEMLKESMHRRLRNQNAQAEDLTTSPRRLLSSVAGTPRRNRNGTVSSGLGQSESGDVIPLRDFLWDPEKAFAKSSRENRMAEEEDEYVGPSSEETLQGCKIDDFELADPRFGGDASLLGRGTYGVVRKLRHKRTGKVYAVKSIEKENVVRAGMVSQVEFELLVQKDLLRHRNVLRCFACVEDSDQVHLILEYCSRGDLYTRIRSQPLRRLGEQEAFIYFSQLVNGLHYLHSRGVMHRDLKLENLLLDGKNVLKIADLGWCGSVLGKAKNFNFCGTLDYLAPEMIKGAGHDWRVDLWGAGILLYEMLDGKPPFQSTRHLELVQQVLKAKVNLGPHIAPDAGDLITKLLRYDPEERITLHTLPQHPWIRRMWLQLRDQYYSRYPHAVPRISAAVASRAPHPGAASVWPLPNACDSLDLRDYLGPPAPTPPPSLTRGPDERTAAMCGAPDAARKGGGRTKSQSEGCSLTNTPGTPVPPVRPTGMKASQVDSANTACAAFAPSQMTASQAPLSTVVGARWDEFPSAPAKKGIAVTEREEALETGEPSGHQSSQNPARQATVTLTAHGKSRDRPGGSPRLVSSGGDILGRSDSRFGGNSTVASSFEALPERSTDSDSEVGDDEGLGCPASTAGNTDGSGPGCRPALQTQNSRPNSLLEPSDSASKLREFPELNDAAVRKTGDEVHDASGRIIEVMSTQASGGKRDLASSERPGPLPFIRNKVSFPSEAVQEETVDDSSVSLPPRRRKKAVASRSIGKSSGSSSNVTQPQSSILQNVSHTGEPKGQPPGSHGEAHQASGSASHLPSKQRRSCVSASVVERSVSKATATLGQDSGLPAKKVIFSAKAPDANGGGSPRRPRSPSCGRRTPGALRKSLRGTLKSMDCTKDSSPSKPAKSSGCGPKIFTGVSRRLNPGSQIKHTVLRADTWNDDAADVGRDRNEDRYEDRLHPARISLGIDALAKAKGETEERASAKRGLQPKRFPCADPQSVRTRQSKRCQISAVTKPSSSTDQPARSTSSLQLPPNCAKPDTPWTSSSCHTDFSMGGFLQPHAPSLGVANEPQSNSVSSIVDHDHGLEGLSSLQCHVAYPFSMSFHPDDQGRLVGSQDGLPLLDPWSAGDCPARPPSQTSHESGELDCFADHLSVGSAGDDLLVPTTECSPDGRQRSDPRNPSSASSRRRSALGPRRPFGAGADSSSHVGVKGQGERKAAPSATQRRGFSADTAGKENRLGAGFNRSSSAQTREQRGAFSRLPSRGVSSVRRERSSDGSTANAPVRREGGRAAPVAQTSSAAAGSCAEAGSASQLGGFKTPVRTEAGYDPLQGVGAGEIIDVAGANPYRIATGFGASFGRNAGGCAPEPRPQLRDPSPASPMPQRRNSPAEGSSGRPGPTSVTSSRVQSPSRLPDGAAHRRPWSTPPSGIGTYYSNLNFPFSTKAVPANTVARPVGTSGTQYVPGRAASPVQWNPSTTLRQRSSANAQAGRNVMHGPLHHPDHSSDTRSVQERSAAFSGNTRRPLSSFGQGSLTASAAARANNMWLSGSPSQINPTYAAPGFAGTQQPAQASYSQMQRWQLQNQLPLHSVLQRTLHAGDVGPTQQGIRRQPWDAGQLQQPSWTTSPVDPPRCACVGSYPHSPKQVSAAWGEGTGNRAPALSQPASPGMYHHSAALAAAGARLPTSSQGGSLQCSWKPVFCSPPPVQLRSVDNARVAGVVWSPQNAAWA
ncbi:aurora kinase [Cystoisospora suis]|uniref:Aurora kinase n=1 Tax=Cystoisospora suis TaxID=483139 RepID=A0A2C6LFB3_9APIC|nr:aurora kinase [Cystoisospora suis]